MRKASPTLIGSFVLGGAALAVLGIVLFGSGVLFENTSKVIMYFRGSVNGLNVGAPVKFKGVPIGQVSEIRLYYDGNQETVAIPVVASLEPDKIATRLGREVDVDRQWIDDLVKAGLRAKLESQSLVTGLLFVSLDFVPGAAPRVVVKKTRYPQIPTLPSTLEEFNKTLSEVLRQIRAVDFQKLMAGVSDTVDGLKRIVNSPEIQKTIVGLDQTLAALRTTVDTLNREMGPIGENVRLATAQASDALAEMRTTLKSMQSTLETAETLIDPNAPLVYQLSQTLEEIGGAAAALRNLANLLEEEPSSVLYGKGETR
jgi:paraquat-inducible protein B